MVGTAVKRNREEESFKMAGMKKKPQVCSKGTVRSLEKGCQLGGAKRRAERRRRSRVSEKGKEKGVGKVVEEDETMVPVVKMPEKNSPEILMYWDECPCFSSAVDQQMLWGSLWFPFWDEEFMSGVYAQNNEIDWEDDLWHLKDIKEIPNLREKYI